jgi:alcohol dehydrogenase (cytochrome c)
VINPKVKPGERRKMITGIPGKTGVVYTLDRTTGEFLWARPTVAQNVISTIDGSTGAVVVNREALFTKINEEKVICPGSNGGKNWPAGAYSPLTNTMYMPLQNMCMTATTTTDTRDPSKVYGLTMRGQLRPAPTRSARCGPSPPKPARTPEVVACRHDVAAATGADRVWRRCQRPVQSARRQDGKLMWELNLGRWSAAIRLRCRRWQTARAAVTGVAAANSDERLAPELSAGNAQNVFVFGLPTILHRFIAQHLPPPHVASARRLKASGTA